MDIFDKQTIADQEVLTEKYPWFQLGVINYLRRIKEESSDEFDIQANRFSDFVFDKELLRKIFNERFKQEGDINIAAVSTYDIEKEYKQQSSIAGNSDLKSLAMSINASKNLKEEANTENQESKPEDCNVELETQDLAIESLPENNHQEKTCTLSLISEADQTARNENDNKEQANNSEIIADDEHSFEAIKARLVKEQTEQDKIIAEPITEDEKEKDSTLDSKAATDSVDTTPTETASENIPPTSVGMPDGALFAETLADLFEKKGKYGMAVKIYEDLKVKFPDSIPIFDERIAKLKSKL